MKNIETEVKGNKLHITVDLTKDYGPSKSGKTVIIASSEGNQKIDGSEAVMGVNIYKKAS